MSLSLVGPPLGCKVYRLRRRLPRILQLIPGGVEVSLGCFGDWAVCVHLEVILEMAQRGRGLWNCFQKTYCWIYLLT